MIQAKSVGTIYYYMKKNILHEIWYVLRGFLEEAMLLLNKPKSMAFPEEQIGSISNS